MSRKPPYLSGLYHNRSLVASMEIALDVIQVVLAAVLVVLVYKLYKKQ